MSNEIFQGAHFKNSCGYALFHSVQASTIMRIPVASATGNARGSFPYIERLHPTLGRLGPVELTSRATGLVPQTHPSCQGNLSVWNIHIMVITTMTPSFVYLYSTSKSKRTKLPSQPTSMLKVVKTMTIEHGGGLSDMIPSSWFIPFMKAVAIYGSLTLALIMEAPHDSELRHQLLHKYLLDDLNSYTDYINSWGIPDLASARAITGLDVDDVARFTVHTVEEIKAMELGWLVCDLGSLLELCDRLEWPLGLLYRTEHSWHALPVLWRKRRAGGAQ